MDMDEFLKQGWSRNRGSILGDQQSISKLLDDALHKEPLVLHDPIFAAGFLPWFCKSDQAPLGVLIPN